MRKALCLATVMLLLLLPACKDMQQRSSDPPQPTADRQTEDNTGREAEPKQNESPAGNEAEPKQNENPTRNEEKSEQNESPTGREAEPKQNISRSGFINQFLATVVGPDTLDIGGGLFQSKDEITRYEAIVIISSALKLRRNAEPNFAFTDEDAISDISYVYAAYNAGIVTGAEDGTFRPDDKLTNEESAAIMEGISKNVVDEEKIGLEVERKFLVSADNIPYDLSRATISEYIQTYINTSPEIRVRMVNESRYTFTIKLPGDDIGLARQEIGFDINQDEYELLFEKRIASPIEKTRYRFIINSGNAVYLDIYNGHLEGLATAEIEFYDVETANKFVPPNWFIRELTSDDRYKNANLALSGLPQD